MAKVDRAPDSMRGAQITTEQSASATSERPSAARQLWAFLRGPYPTLLSRLFLGGIFLLYGLVELTGPLQFVNDIHGYGLGIPRSIEDIMARTLPIVEIGVGIWLLIGLFTRFSAIIASVLMTIFTIAITQAWFRGIDANCGCGNITGRTDFAAQLNAGVMKALGPVGDFFSYEKIGPVPVLRDLLFLLMGLHLIFVPTIFALDALRRRYSRANVNADVNNVNNVNVEA